MHGAETGEKRLWRLRLKTANYLGKWTAFGAIDLEAEKDGLAIPMSILVFSGLGLKTTLPSPSQHPKRNMAGTWRTSQVCVEAKQASPSNENRRMDVFYFSPSALSLVL